MRRLTTLVGLIALVAAACGGTSPSPSPSAATITTHVTFDGQECRYDGPATVPDGTKLVFVFDGAPPQRLGIRPPRAPSRSARISW